MQGKQSSLLNCSHLGKSQILFQDDSAIRMQGVRVSGREVRKRTVKEQGSRRQTMANDAAFKFFKILGGGDQKSEGSSRGEKC